MILIYLGHKFPTGKSCTSINLSYYYSMVVCLYLPIFTNLIMVSHWPQSLFGIILILWADLTSVCVCIYKWVICNFAQMTIVRLIPFATMGESFLLLLIFINDKMWYLKLPMLSLFSWWVLRCFVIFAAATIGTLALIYTGLIAQCNYIIW